MDTIIIILIRAFIGHENDLLTVQNRLTTLCKYESQHIARRTIENEDNPFPAIISSIEGLIYMVLTAWKNS